jgi:hypothetical protein
VFGRDEGGSEFSFTQRQVDMLLEKWSQNVRAVGYYASSKPTAAFIMVVELCVSDKTKPLLLANPAFIPYLVDALLLVRTHMTYYYSRLSYHFRTLVVSLLHSLSHLTCCCCCCHYMNRTRSTRELA